MLYVICYMLYVMLVCSVSGGFNGRWYVIGGGFNR
jgi:hypothetical protein